MACRRLLLDVATIALCVLFAECAWVAVFWITELPPPLDHSAAYQRSIEEQFRTIYTDYQHEVRATNQALQRLLTYKAHHGAPASYPRMPQVDEAYIELHAIWIDDRQALKTSVADYNALATSRYTAPYRPSDLPASLTVPAP